MGFTTLASGTSGFVRLMCVVAYAVGPVSLFEGFIFHSAGMHVPSLGRSLVGWVDVLCTQQLLQLWSHKGWVEGLGVFDRLTRL